MSMWIAGATLLVGTGTAVYGAQQNKKLAAANRDANKEAAELADESNWRRFLYSKGVGDNGEVVNAKLPMWAKVATSTGARRLIPKGTAPAPVRRLVARKPAASGSATAMMSSGGFPGDASNNIQLLR